MIDAKQQIYRCVELQALQRIGGGFIDEAHSVWDKLEGNVSPYCDFMKLYVAMKWARWLNELGKN